MLKAHRRDVETRLIALDQYMGISTKKDNKYSLFQYSILQSILIVLTGITLYVIGVRLVSQP